MGVAVMSSECGCGVAVSTLAQGHNHLDHSCVWHNSTECLSCGADSWMSKLSPDEIQRYLRG